MTLPQRAGKDSPPCPLPPGEGSRSFADHFGARSARAFSPCPSLCFGQRVSRARNSRARSPSLPVPAIRSNAGLASCDGGHLSAAYKGRCAAILPRSVRGPVKLALCSACGLGCLPCPRQPGTPLLSHANPHRIGTDRLRDLECIAVLHKAGRLRAGS